MKQSPPEQKVALLIGLAVVLIALIANEWVLTLMFSADHDIRNFQTKIFIWVIDLILLCVGLGFVIFRRNRRVAGLSVNLLVFLISSGVVVIVLESTFPVSQQLIPAEFRNHIPWPYSVLSQTTKISRVPREYVAIFGDSYAEGLGDWFYETGKSSADILASQLNLDVVTFGRGGASSITGVVINPLAALRKLDHRTDIEDPKTILIYFYEGNDLDNTLIDNLLRQPSYFEYSGSNVLKRDTYYGYLDHILTHYEGKINKHILYVREVVGSWFIVSRTLWGIARQGMGEALAYIKNTKVKVEVGKLSRDNVPPADVKSENLEGQELNTAYFGDEVVALQNIMQGPALQLDKAERLLALTIFEYCVGYITERFPEARIIIVYVPSPLSSYSLASDVRVEKWTHLIGADSIHWAWPEILIKRRKYFQDRPVHFSREEVLKSSDFIAEEIKKIAKILSVGFVDPREEMRTSFRLLHGPKDQPHFNRVGYEILATTILKHLLATLGTR
jgi:hypothetical protein